MGAQLDTRARIQTGGKDAPSTGRLEACPAARVSSCALGELALRNEIANLAQNVKPGSCEFDFLLFRPAVWQVQKVKPSRVSIFHGMALKMMLKNHSLHPVTPLRHGHGFSLPANRS